MKTQELFDRLNTSHNLEDITKEDLFEIETTMSHNDAPAGIPIKEAANEYTEPGAILLWEFNEFNFHNRSFDNDEDLSQAAFLLSRFVHLLERLNISTKYDCDDSYGSQSENPRIAAIEQMIFEQDDDEIEIAKKVAMKSGLITEKEFDALTERFA